jgi:small subunit ribosomal protein S1
MILDIDEERRRISLGIKQCFQNPWDGFAESFEKGDKISGNIKSITDFGIFLGLDGNIDGLVHLSDISWDETGEEAVRNYSKGDEVETVILSIDPERERISLGIKQLQDDPFMNYAAQFEKGSIVKGVVMSMDAKAATLSLDEGVEATLRASEIGREKVEDVRVVLKEGEEVEVKITNIDRKSRGINVSIKALEIDDEKAAIKEHKKQESADVSPGTIGDLIKAELDKG